MGKKVSVIVPIYNRANCMRKCVDSLLDQTYDNYEIILVDDGSTDDSPRICQEYAEKFPDKVRWIRKKNGGAASARNAGMDAASGEFWSFCDSDDWVDRNWIESLANAMSEEGVVWAYGRCIKECFDGKSSELISPDCDGMRAKDVPVVYGKTNLFHFSALGCYRADCGLRFDERIRRMEDTPINLRYFTSFKEGSIRRVDDACYHYVIDTPNSLSKNCRPNPRAVKEVVRFYFLAIRRYRDWYDDEDKRNPIQPGRVERIKNNIHTILLPELLAEYALEFRCIKLWKLTRSSKWSIWTERITNKKLNRLFNTRSVVLILLFYHLWLFRSSGYKSKLRKLGSSFKKRRSAAIEDTRQ